jgi:hypothetical protein
VSAHLFPKDAKDLATNPTDLTNEKLAECWKSIAGHISFLNADDYGGDWKLVPQWKPTLDALDAEHDRRNLPRPSRSGWLL